MLGAVRRAAPLVGDQAVAQRTGVFRRVETRFAKPRGISTASKSASVRVYAVVVSEAMTIRAKEPERRVCTTTRVPVETLHLEAEEGTKEPLDILIVPGNPGVPAYYAHYARTLWEDLDGRADIEVIGYLGHSEANLGVDGWFTLKDQLEHLVEYIKSTRPVSNGRKTLLIGHSIGAEMALHAMDTLGTDRVPRVVGLMPFMLTNKDSLHQRFLSLLVHIYPLVRTVAAVIGIISMLPEALKRVALSPVVCQMEAPAAHMTQRWLRHNSVINMALMGRTEFDALQQLDYERIERHAARLALLYCPDDHWAPMSQLDMFRAQMPKSIQLVRFVQICVVNTFHDYVCSSKRSSVE